MASEHGGAAIPAGVRARFSRALALVYFTRTVVSLGWVTGLALLNRSGAGDPPAAIVWAWLVLYPVVDAVATALDIRSTPRGSRTRTQPLNLVVGLVAAAALALAALRGFGSAIETFGLWAIVGGAIQIVVAVRRTVLLSAQWLMIISGAGSVFAGVAFLRWHGSVDNGLSTLVQYSIGGAVWYLLAAFWMVLAARRHYDHAGGDPRANPGTARDRGAGPGGGRLQRLEFRAGHGLRADRGHRTAQRVSTEQR